MASDRTDQLMDLLYGELSSEDEASLRAEIEGDEELHDELTGFESLLGEVREALPMEEPPAGVRASIMAAARQAAEARETEKIEEQARAERRPPERKAPLGIWGRMSGSRASQAALVAAVLLAGAFVFRFVDLSSNRMHGYDEVAMEAMPESTSAPSSADPALAQEEELAEVVEAEAGSEAAAQAELQPSPLGEGAAEKPLAEEPAELALKQEAKAEPAPAREATRPKPAPRHRRASKATGVKRPASRAKAKKADVWEGLVPVDAPAPSPRRRAKPEPAPAAPEKEADSIALDNDLMRGGGGAVAEEKEAAEGAYRPTPGTIEAVAEAYRSGDWRETIRQADRLLASAAGTSTDQARAMQLKAQALMRLGRLQEADRVLASLQADYPGFQSSQISQQRAEIARQLDTAVAKRKARRDAEAAEPADEAASEKAAEPAAMPAIDD